MSSSKKNGESAKPVGGARQIGASGQKLRSLDPDGPGGWLAQMKANIAAQAADRQLAAMRDGSRAVHANGTPD